MSLPQVLGALGIVFHDDKILLIQRLDTAGDQWFFPGGRLNPGESAAEAVCREILEETGIATQVKTHLGQRQTFSAAKNYELILEYFECEHLGQTTITPQLEEVKACEWKSISEAEILLGPTVFEKALELIRSKTRRSLFKINT